METAEIPNFKLAKVGKKDRKKGGLPFGLGGGGSGSGFAGALGGSGSGAGALGALLSKAAVMLVVGMLGVGAYNVGKGMAPKMPKKAPPKPFAQAEKPKYSDLSGVIKTQDAGASSLSMVSGSLDGKTPEQRAAEAAAAEAAAKAEAERKAKEEADAAAAATGPADAAGKAAGGGMPDAAALAGAVGAAGSAAPGGKGSPFGSRFGQLSSGLGGGHSGLSGGAGMSGGIGRQFEAGKLGQMKAMPQATTPGRTSAKPVANNGRSGRAFKQLQAAKQRSVMGAQAPSAEGASQAADSAFNNNPGANSAITGGGAGTSGAGSGGTAAPGANPGGNSGGGPTTGSEGTDSGTGDDPCPAEGCPGSDVTPWGGLVKLASMCILIASIILGVAALLASAPAGISTAAAEWLGGIAAALGGIALLLGAAILAQGQKWQGALFMTMGGLVTTAGLLVAVNPAQTTWANNGIAGSWDIIVTDIAAVLGTGVGITGLTGTFD